MYSQNIYAALTVLGGLGVFSMDYSYPTSSLDSRMNQCLVDLSVRTGCSLVGAKCM